MAANLSTIARERLREEVRLLLSAGRFDSSAARDLSLRYQCSERSVWRARRWVLDYLRIIDPVDRDRERRATLLSLDSVTTQAAAAGKYRDAIMGLKLRIDLLGLDSTEGEGRPSGRPESVADLLERVRRGAEVADLLADEAVHEDEEEEEDGEVQE